MAEKYGIKTKVLKGDASTPVVMKSCLVVFGSAANTDELYGEPKKVYSYKEYLDLYHGGTAPSLESPCSLDIAAEYALTYVDSIWCVNCNKDGLGNNGAASEITEVLDSALRSIVLNTSDIPNMICIPEVQDSSCLNALVSACKGGINKLYYAQGFIDCAQNVNQLTMNASGVYTGIDTTKITAPNTDGCLIAGWGNVILDEVEGRTKYVPASVVLATRRAEQDAINIEGVPYRSVGNLRTSMKGLSIVSSGAHIPLVCPQETMNMIAENGIVSFVNKGANRWYTWGDHTAAVAQGNVEDETYRFDSTVAVLYHILNRFINKWGNVIDSPMTLRLRDCILAEEQDYLNGLKAMGCVVGTPVCEFRPLENTSDTLGKGQFYFTNIATVVPPAKYLELGIQYTDAGLMAYIPE